MSHLDLNVGDIIRHHKRGSEYEVLGFSVINAMDQRDGRAVKRHIDDIPVLVHQQCSTRQHGPLIAIVYYRALESKPGEPWLFTRPGDEFTADRFEKVS